MNVAQVMAALSKLPPKADCFYLWDGAACTGVDHVYLSKTGLVILSGENEVCYSDNARPVDAPSSKQDGYWQPPAKSGS